jgi:hypothetical protein
MRRTCVKTRFFPSKTWPFSFKNMAVFRQKHGRFPSKTWPFSVKNMAVFRQKQGRFP